MPTPSDSLTSDSSDEAIRQAISDTVAQLVEEGFPQDQAVAIAFEQASEATGKELAQGGESRTRSAR